MFSGSYTSEGVAGLLAEGGTARRDEAVRIAEMLGGTLDAYYWCYGDTDFMCIMDVPDSAKIAKLALHIGASGTFSGGNCRYFANNSGLGRRLSGDNSLPLEIFL